jgi:hypothetical protein
LHTFLTQGNEMKPVIDNPCQFYRLTFEFDDGTRVGESVCFS